MNSKTTTEVKQAPPSPEELRYLDAQSALTTKQLEILGSQQDFNEQTMAKLTPILDQQTQLLSQALAAQNDPDQLALAKESTAAQLQALRDNADLAPLQKQVLQKQLEDSLRGPGATPEQSAAIDAATNAALEKGKSDINSFTGDQLEQLRTSLSPSLGLRPTDTPIVDRAGRVQQEATRQYGQLTSTLAQANAEAKLNYPLAASGVEQAGANFAGSLDQASKAFQAGLSEQANINRLRLLGSASDIIGGGTQTGIGLVTGSRGNPLSFQRGSTSTVTKAPGIIDYIGAAGGLMQGLGAMGLSDERAKTDIETIAHDDAGRRLVSFKYRGDPEGKTRVGYIAQEIERTDPEAVMTDGRGVKYIAYNRLFKEAS